MTKDTSFCAMVYELIATIPPGKLSTYGDLAENLGYPGNARQVAACLSRLARSSPRERDRYKDLPWHRVMRSDLRVAFPPEHPAFAEQHKKLAAEGVRPQTGSAAGAAKPRFAKHLRHKFVYAE